MIMVRACKPLLYCVVVCAGTVCVLAQTDDSPGSTAPPPGPLLAKAPALSQWTITFSYPEETKAQGTAYSPDTAKAVLESLSARVKTVVTTKTGDIIHEETTTLGGNKTEDWQVRGSYYIKYPGKNVWSAYEKNDSALSTVRFRTAMILPDSGFNGLDWIGSDSYAGKIKTSTGENLVFVPGGMSTLNVADPAGQAKLQTLPKVAYVDSTTHLPVMVRTPSETRQFTFSPHPPSSVQTLPADLADEIKAGEAIRSQRTGAPAREY